MLEFKSVLGLPSTSFSQAGIIKSASKIGERFVQSNQTIQNNLKLHQRQSLENHEISQVREKKWTNQQDNP